MFSIKEYKSILQDFYNNEDQSKAKDYIREQASNIDNNEFKAECYYDLARIEKFEGNYDKSLSLIKMALQNNPGIPYYHLEYALLSEKTGNIIQATDILLNLVNSGKNFEFTTSKLLELTEKLVKANEKNEQDKEIRNSLQNFKSKSKLPLISIIILGYNKIEYSQKCIDSVLKNTNYENYELLFLDNASTDETSTIVESYGSKIKYIRSDKNLGFVGGNNYAAKFANGDYIVFLNNDTEVKKEWLNSLYNTFLYHPDAGAVGSKLIYPDGSLQEAGGIIFNDATGWNFGKGDDPNYYLYDFTREVDYCSGASLMVRKDIFDELGGFDERFAPAYYEDTDLCFSVRELGYKVYYCHSSIVVHHEGATAGTDLSKGFKKYQVINGPKFIEKWKDELKKQYPPDPNLKLKFFNRNKSKKILIIDDIPPLPNQAAGALRHYHTLKQMLNLGYQVTYVHLMGRKYYGEENFEYFHEFKSRGVEFIWFNYEYWWEFRESPQINKTLKELIDTLQLGVRNYDYIYIAFWHIAEYFIDFIRASSPQTPILIDTMDIHFLREMREAEIKNSKKLLEKALKNKERELEVYRKADCITTVTLKDRDILRKELPEKPIFILTDVHDPVEKVAHFQERENLVFVGNFNHQPNVDAVKYFVKEIFPLIKSSLPEVKFYVVGGNPPEEILSFANESIIVTGWIPKVEPYLEKSKISVIPLRFGAGNKGKVGESLAMGLPMVSTTIGAEGMGIKNREHALISDNPQEFAEMVVELYNDAQLWQKLSVNGKRLIGTLYTSELMRQRLDYIFSFDSKEKLKSEMALNEPEPRFASVIIPSFNKYELLKQAIESILKNNYPQIEIVIVDNASDEITRNYLKEISDKENIRIILNEENVGFPGAVNQGILASKGKYLIVANNDIIVPPNTISRMVEVAESSTEIGIVGTMSNYVSGPQLDKKASYNSPVAMLEYAEKLANEQKGEFIHFPRVAFLFTLIKKEVINQIGGLDERFNPGNFEDDDFCLRAQLAGYKTIIAKDTFVHHFGSQSFKEDGNEAYDARIEKNRNIFIDKWGGDPEDIWIRGKEIKKRDTLYPISENKFVESMRRALIHHEEEDYDLALREYLSALVNYNAFPHEEFKLISEDEIYKASIEIARLLGRDEIVEMLLSDVHSN